MRVRFAPSPTGLLHIGNARTAIVNYAFALKNNAEFILRLDDTDLARSKDVYAKAIQEDLKWLGVEWALFFKQSDRFDRYHEVSQDWIQKRLLYPCFETADELEFKRKRQLSQGKPPIYDRASMTLTKDQIALYEKEGRRPHWRFYLGDEPMIWNDLVRGKCEVNPHHVSDPVLIKEDGTYLYTLSSVIDDVDYQITHILRGEDHVTNTGVQLHLFKALNYTPDHFAHTSLIMDVDGKPLSKRLGSLGLQTLSQEGLEPMTLVNFLLTIGTHLPIQAFSSWADAVQNFDFSHFGRSAAKFDETELWLLNHKVIAAIPYCGPHKDVWEIVCHNLAKRQDFETWIDILKGDAFFKTDIDQKLIQSAIETLPDTFLEDTWKEWTTSISEKTGTKGKALYAALRQMLTGMDHGPEMKKIIQILGRDKIQKRLSHNL